jgi:hypothetical protein
LELDLESVWAMGSESLWATGLGSEVEESGSGLGLVWATELALELVSEEEELESGSG